MMNYKSNFIENEKSNGKLRSQSKISDVQVVNDEI